MTIRTVHPGGLSGRASAPPSKSYTHRGLVAGFLRHGRFAVESPLDADDTRATGLALHRLGAEVHYTRRRWTLDTRRSPASARPTTIDCGESGTTLRFVTVLAALGTRPVRFRGRGRLGERPMLPLVTALSELGAIVRPARGSVPFTVHGPIHGARLSLDASVSSQFTSALLLALPTLAEDSRIVLEGRIVSEPYVEATLAVVRRLGVRVRRRGREFRISGGQTYTGQQLVVPGDASSAAYLWVAGAIAGGPVSVRGVTREWPQADLAVLDLLTRSGADVREGQGAISVRPGTPRPFSMDLTDCPDLYPLAGVLAATLPGTSRLRGAVHVIHKESNRRAETARIVSAFGARVREVAGGLSIEGRERLRPVDLPDLTDHRLVMSAAVGALAASGPSRLGDARVVGKSFPGFWKTIEGLGAEVDGR
jgi:3-phosphoshikimate 1-carboxyvinyltransferase